MLLMSSDGPVLALDDILRTMSPSPVPQPPDAPPATLSHLSLAPISHNTDSAPIMDTPLPPPRVPSPEPLDLPELENMRARVQQYSLTLDPTNNKTESELVAMVLRLTSHLLLHPSPAQLASQAETIADLTFQRNMLLVEKSECEARWQAERDRWASTAHVLLKKVSVAREPFIKEQETHRYIARLEDDIKAYRRKLADTHARLLALESELTRLKPLLAMHATVLRDTDLWRSEALSTVACERSGKKSKGKERAAPSTEWAVHAPGCSEKDTGLAPARPAVTPIPDQCEDARDDPNCGTRSDMLTLTERRAEPGLSQSSRPLKSRFERQSFRKDRDKDKDKDRDGERDKDKDKKRRHRNDPTPLLTDARAEFILVAARRLGRVRAGVIADLVKEQQVAEREAKVLSHNTQAVLEAEQGVDYAPQVSAQAEAVVRITTPVDTHASHESEGPPSSPPVSRPLQSHRTQSSSPPRRKLVPTPAPFSSSGAVSLSHTTHLPTHLQPSLQPFPAAAVTPGHHSQPMPHPGFVYYPGPGQGPMPIMVPMPWPIPPGSPPAQTGAKAKQTPQAQALTPALKRNAAGEGGATPMDSLVSAARTLIEDEDFNEEGASAEGSAGAPGVPDVDAETVAGDETEEDIPIRRGTRRRAAAPPVESPSPKRRRVGASSSGSSNTLSASQSAASTSISAPVSVGKTTRRTKAAIAAAQAQAQAQTQAQAQVQQKSKPKGRGRGRGRAQTTRTQSRMSPPPTSPIRGAREPTGSESGLRPPPQVARIPSALEVLADQAAQEQERRPSMDIDSPRVDESAEGEDGEPEIAAPAVGRRPGPRAARGRSRGRGRRRGKGKERAVGVVPPNDAEEAAADPEGDADVSVTTPTEVADTVVDAGVTADTILHLDAGQPDDEHMDELRPDSPPEAAPAVNDDEEPPPAPSSEPLLPPPASPRASSPTDTHPQAQEAEDAPAEGIVEDTSISVHGSSETVGTQEGQSTEPSPQPEPLVAADTGADAAVDPFVEPELGLPTEHEHTICVELEPSVEAEVPAVPAVEVEVPAVPAVEAEVPAVSDDPEIVIEQSPTPLPDAHTAINASPEPVTVELLTDGPVSPHPHARVEAEIESCDEDAEGSIVGDSDEEVCP